MTVLPSRVPRADTPPPTHTPRAILAPPSALPTAALISAPPTALSLTATHTPPSLAARVSETQIATSVQGRPITARRYGDPNSARALLIVGGIHGGYEINTVMLMDAVIAHLDAQPDALPSASAVIVVRAANPDGLAYPNEARGRFNANGVDLNRNWACDWTANARWRSQPVSAGARPLSEPETAGLAAYIEQIRPAAVLFYHSAAGGVFAGDCNAERMGRASDSFALAAVVGAAAGYSYGVPFTAYPVTGTAASYVDGLGIPSADVELFTQTDAEFEANWRAIRAVLDWLAA
jgi:predicted deacylase